MLFPRWATGIGTGGPDLTPFGDKNNWGDDEKNLNDKKENADNNASDELIVKFPSVPQRSQFHESQRSNAKVHFSGPNPSTPLLGLSVVKTQFAACIIC